MRRRRLLDAWCAWFDRRSTDLWLWTYGEDCKDFAAAERRHPVRYRLYVAFNWLTEMVTPTDY